MNLLKKATALFDSLENTLAFLGGMLIVFAMFAVTIDVSCRFLFNRPIGWVFEVTEFIMLIAPMIGGAWLLKMDGHVNIDTVLNCLSEKSRSLVSMVTSVVGAMTCLFIAYWGGLTTWSHYERGVMTSGIVKFPKYMILVFVPLGFFLLFLEFLRKISLYHKRWKAPLRKEPVPEHEEPSGL